LFKNGKSPAGTKRQDMRKDRTTRRSREKGSIKGRGGEEKNRG